MKLTQRDQRVLKAMQDGGVCIYHPYAGRMNPHEYYSIRGKIDKCTKEIKRLIKFGLVRVTYHGFQKCDVFLTPEGESFKCELEEPYDVWVVVVDYEVKVYKHSGFLKGETFLTDGGNLIRKGNSKEFFTDRDKAFAYAFKRQMGIINGKETALNLEHAKLEDMKKHLDNPEMDKSGYL